MIRRKSLFQTLSAFACLALLALSGPLSARTPKSISSAGHTANSPSVAGAPSNAHALLYQQLCELNANWLRHTPNFEVITPADLIVGEVPLIQTHLKLVISQLRSANVGHLSDSQLAQRSAHLQTLQTYMADGNFPQNVFVAGRRPVFIDPWGTHCAVGHLITTSGHSQLARSINREHQLDLLRDIKTDGLSEWQHASGLSVQELQLIQPTYRSKTLRYPKEIEDLILGNSEMIAADVASGELSVDARCGGKTLLHFAAVAGDLALVKLLVENGADLHAVSRLGCDKTELSKGGKQTVVTVRWNQSTSVTSRGGMGMGIYGPVMKTQRGQMIASILDDLRGGRAGLNALDYATETPHHYGLHLTKYSTWHWPGHGGEVVPKNEIIETLKTNRAAVAAWLQEQGLKTNRGEHAGESIPNPHAAPGPESHRKP